MEKTKSTKDLIEELEAAPQGCGPMARWPLLSVLLAATCGIAIGIGLSFWEDDGDTKGNVIMWIGLAGDLFIRSLKCVILPLVFINVIISVIDMMNVGRAGAIGWKTVAIYVLTTLIASIIGVISIVLFKPLFRTESFGDTGPATLILGCGDDNSYVTESATGALECAANLSSMDESTFTIEEITGSFVRASGNIEEISLSETIYAGVFTKLFSDNIVMSFVDMNFAAVVFCAIIFGVAAARIMMRAGGEENSHIMPLLKELDSCLLLIINWIILCTPFAVFSLIVAAVGGQDDLIDSFANVGYLVLASFTGFILQVLCVHVGLFYAFTRINPFPYLKKIAPAQTMAFACASSAATIPMTLKSVRSTGLVPESILKFVVPLGATINMDGSAIYFPCACIWLAVLNNVDVNAGHILLLVIIATIGSAGTAPVPSSALVLIVTAYNTVFGTTGIPKGFEFVVAIDWFLDRCITVMNVTGDTVVCAIISKHCPIDDDTLDVEDNSERDIDIKKDTNESTSS